MKDENSNIINLNGYFSKDRAAESLSDKAQDFLPENNGNSEIVDLDLKRLEKAQAERRDQKRTIISATFGVFLVIPKHGLQEVRLHDISEKGMAFDLPYEMGQFRMGEKVAVRVYLNQQCYFPFVVDIKNVRAFTRDAIYRHGASFSEEDYNKALFYFVRFIEAVSTQIKVDTGDRVAPSTVRS